MSITRRTFKEFRSAWIALICLQAPAASMDLWQFTTEKVASNDWIAIGLCFPYFSVVSVISFAATYLWIRSDDKNLKGAFKSAFSQIGRLVFSRVLVDAITLLCLGAFLVPAIYAGSQVISTFDFWSLPSFLAGIIALACALPGLYYTAIYFYVPAEVLEDPKAPVLACFTRSKRLALKHLTNTAGIVVLLFLFGLFQYACLSGLGSFVASGFSKTTAEWVSLGFQTIGALILGALVDVWIAYYYIDKRKMPA